VIYERNKLYDPIVYLDPRFLLKYRLTANSQLQLAATVTSQNTHIVNYINNFLPIEIWTPSTNFLKPERNYQVSLGYSGEWRKWDVSAAIYQKHVRNVLDYASPVFTNSTDIESNLLAGQLNVQGAEIMLTYRFTTWYSTAVSYAYTRTRQTVEGINYDQPYVATGARPHYFSWSQFFNWSKKWQITTNYIRHSGAAITLPNGQFIIDGTAFPLYEANRNTERLPTFRRLDLSFRRQLGVKKKKDHWNLKFTVTNFFNRYNPSVAYPDHEIGQPNQLIIRSVDYSPFMLSISLNFKY
jgi:outer membrane cobalamin receptor